MPIFPDLFRGDNGVVSDLLVDVFCVHDNALRQYHWHARVHLCDLGIPPRPKGDVAAEKFESKARRLSVNGQCAQEVLGGGLSIVRCVAEA